MKKVKVPTMVKNDQKIEQRRKQILEASIAPFKEKGYHRTTTREIAENADMSFGAIYEYVGKKEDILYLFFEALYDRLNEMLDEKITDKHKGLSRLESFFKVYFTVMDEIRDEVNIMYRETRSLTQVHLNYVFSKETEFVEYVRKILSLACKEENLEMDEDVISMVTHNIIVSGHMWGFRRWILKKNYTLDKFIKIQTQLILNSISMPVELED